MKTLCYTEQDALDFKPWTIEKAESFEVYYGCLLVQTAQTFGAALDIITKIKSPQTIGESWSDCDGVDCQLGCETCYPIQEE